VVEPYIKKKSFSNRKLYLENERLHVKISAANNITKDELKNAASKANQLGLLLMVITTRQLNERLTRSLSTAMPSLAEDALKSKELL
jgi:hypothetical protein